MTARWAALVAALAFVYVASGNASPPTFSFQQAYAAAAVSGGTVPVNGGAYGAEEPGEGAIDLTAIPNAKPVQFVCGDGLPVTFAYPAEQFVITGDAHVTFTGSCFHFNRLWIGSGSAGVGAADVTIDGASMWIFDISGAQNVTIENSTVGPDVACGPQGTPAACQNNASDNEQFWYQAQLAGCGCDNGNFNEPKVHDNQNGQPTSNVVIKNNLIERIQSRDPSNWHAGCLWTGYANGTGLTVTGNQFKDCMAYNILLDNISPNLTITSNTFSQSRDAIRSLPGTDAGFASIITEPYQDIESKCFNNEVVSGLTIAGNSLVNGFDITAGCAGMSLPGAVLQGSSGSAPPPPPGLGLKLSLVTVVWTAAPGARGYQLYRDGVLVSTAGSKATSAKFSTGPGSHTFTVAAIGTTITQTLAVSN